MNMPFDEKILEEAHDWVESNCKVVLATVIKTWGSSPRQIGSKMIVKLQISFQANQIMLFAIMVATTQVIL